MSKTTEDPHTEAFVVLAKGLLDKEHLQAAKDHPMLKPIFEKLSDHDVRTLCDIALNQQRTDCNLIEAN